MPTALLYNPAAGRGLAPKLRDRALRAAGAHWPRIELLETREPGDGVRLAREAATAGIDLLLVLGGDGTVHEAANGVRAAGAAAPRIGVLPCGTGNDFAKLVGTARCRPEEAVRRLAAGAPATFDTGEAWGERFVNSAGVGLDAEVAHELRTVKRLRGTAAYAVALLRTLRSFRALELEVSVAGERWTGRWTAVVLGNGQVEGGSFRLTPDARPDDGQLDLCAVSALGTARLLTLIPTLFWGGHGRFREVRLTRVTGVVIRSPGAPLRLHLDGEIRAPGPREVEFRVVPASLPVLIGRR
ncbi:MAG TPA: diacylglycerol kinase family protein [Gemmatimonadales bacterium]|nr:diacylglycerol kinase family protein [Gemmatimonadales bacterium]